jgi:uncharacterized phage-like protein YoqJ
MTTLAITGHRLGPRLGGYKPNSLGLAVQRALRSEIQRLQPKNGIVGMATGVDQWGGWIFSKLGIPFIAAVPFEGQELAWPTIARERYNRLLAKADEVHLVGHLTPQQREDSRLVNVALYMRNCWMVDNSTKLLAVWDGARKGGTWNCLRYAESVGREVVRIDPRRVG